jgi:hypothetical protein
LDSQEPVRKDSAVKFECFVDAFPKPSVIWMINGKEVSNKDGVQIEKDVDNNRYTLNIPKANSSIHAGEVTVKASNSFGFIQNETILKIYGN